MAAAYFCDAYGTRLQNPQASVVDIFFGVFGHHPLWIKWVLRARNGVASVGGLEVPAKGDIMSPQRKSSYAVGDNIGCTRAVVRNQLLDVVLRDRKRTAFIACRCQLSGANQKARPERHLLADEIIVRLGRRGRGAARPGEECRIGIDLLVRERGRNERKA